MNGSRPSPGSIEERGGRPCLFLRQEPINLVPEWLVETVRVVCAHDCPDMCSLLAEIEDGRVLRIKGDPEQPFTAGFACAKVNRDAELVHSPARLQTPLRRIGAKGEGRFAPIGWDEALDEITSRWQQVITESGPEALLGYAYSAHQGMLNRGLLLGLFRTVG